MGDATPGGHGSATHDVHNQPPPLTDYDLFASDRALSEAVAREGGGWANASLGDFGRRLGRAETIDWGFQANRNPPVLQSFDRYGRRRDVVEFHPAWHSLMTLGGGGGRAYRALGRAQARRACRARRDGATCSCQIEAGVQCPITMTYGVVPGAAAAAGDRAQTWLPRLYSRRYDPRFRPAAREDRRAHGHGHDGEAGRLGSARQHHARHARRHRRAGPAYRLVGHKWFFSAPMCDAFLVLAQAPKGLSCFLLPRWTPDGAPNALQLQRLKDKLGNRSNASSEVEFDGALAWLVGEEGRGIPTIIEMATYTRLDCALGTAGLMRQAVAQAIHHARHRSAFQRRLVDQPLMTGVLADLALESEAATALSLRLARAFDRRDDASETAFRRV